MRFAVAFLETESETAFTDSDRYAGRRMTGNLVRPFPDGPRIVAAHWRTLHPNTAPHGARRDVALVGADGVLTEGLTGRRTGDVLSVVTHWLISPERVDSAFDTLT